MLNILNHILNVFKKKSAIEPADVPRSSPNYMQAERIGLLVYLHEETHYPVFQKFVRELRKDKKKVQILAYKDKNACLPENFPHDIFDKKEIASNGNIRSQQIEQFVNRRFDYLLCVSEKLPEPLYHVLLQSQARCRAGKLFPDKKDSLDLMIILEDKGELHTLIDQMFFYIKKLNRNK